ncbi:class I SAM-dependent methyltransferase [Propionibacterium freudenreichii]|jgi:ubiquinone/menaquinone biosynthesis C-methylase UbiE|uniref:class I SAM-dependent methyltransferase n=1 Tax=Propionibacterium freudenreichii TaxID=1744 RepID=UPI002550AF24|nr:methyltransferase domain-containing protein [Propionibacterium freudenreichii]MDK9662382.1 class I SAM-dependent methyltransferase [Propionibacterium freudenreichii]
MADQHPFAQRWNADTQYYPRIADLLEGHDVVLDAGCGEGTLARYLASSEAAFGQPSREGHHVIGLDADAKVLPPEYPGVHFMLGDAQQLPFPDASFDGVVAVGVLRALNADLGLVEMRRVVRPGGRVVILDTARNRIPVGIRHAYDALAGVVTRIRRTSWHPDVLDTAPELDWRASRELIEANLPGATWKRLPFARWLAVWDAPAD